MEDLTKSDEIEFTDEVFSFPPVRIAVVAHKENDWFQESVASFANLNYLDKQLTVLTTGQMEWVEPIVSQYFPDAEILEVDPEAGLGANFNAVLSNHDEPAFYLFCHHDVALAPDALRLMVEESYRSNAAVVGPKVVNWERPNELLDVGNVMNSLAVAVQRVEAGEIDQEQFDSVEQVFAVSNTTFLVRADLFRALGGFDEEMGMFGEDLDFCWRAQIAGGKVMLVPGAIARHRDESGEYQTNPKRNRLMERHRLRSILSNYGKVRVLPMLLLNLLISTIRGILGLLRGRLTNLLILIDSFIWNLLNVKSLIQKRKVISKLRQVTDSELLALNTNSYHTQRVLPSLDTVVGAKQGSNGRLYAWINELRSGPSKVSVAFSLLSVTLFLFGSRHLFTRKVPVVGEFVPFDSGPKEIFELWASGYWTSGLGYEGA
ncbi:MAG: glycosyltransferase, partial [Actinomycetota bacterium]|nr:glycosyltransferase [Actinomycetota bacterium]